MAADQRVERFVEEPAVAEVERQTLVAATVDVGAQPAVPAHRECRLLDAIEEDLERQRLAFSEPERQGSDADRGVELSGHGGLPLVPGMGSAARCHANGAPVEEPPEVKP